MRLTLYSVKKMDEEITRVWLDKNRYLQISVLMYMTVLAFAAWQQPMWTQK